MFKGRKVINNKGITFLDTLISLIIVIMIVVLIGNFQIFFKLNNNNLNKKLILFETINNKIVDIYNNNDWSSLTDEVVPTEYGEIHISYNNYQNLTANFTSQITIVFDFKGTNKEYIIERSIY